MIETAPLIITTIGAVIDLVSKLHTSTSSLDKTKLEFEMSQIMRELTKANIEANRLINRINELEKIFEEDKNNPLTVDYYGVYFDTKHIPYCTACYSVKQHTRIPLSRLTPANNLNIYQCPSCQVIYQSTN